MRRGGTIWWDDGKHYVEVQKKDGPVIIIGLDDDGGLPEYPNLARILKTATQAELDGTTYREAHDKLTEQRVEGWWGRFAAALLDLAHNLKANG